MEAKHEFLKKKEGHGGSPMKEVHHDQLHKQAHGPAAEQERHPRKMEPKEGEGISQPSKEPHMGEGH